PAHTPLRYAAAWRPPLRCAALLAPASGILARPRRGRLLPAKSLMLYAPSSTPRRPSMAKERSTSDRQAPHPAGPAASLRPPSRPSPPPLPVPPHPCGTKDRRLSSPPNPPTATLSCWAGGPGGGRKRPPIGPPAPFYRHPLSTPASCQRSATAGIVPAEEA